jgi:glycosyltransferase involved in cell wall biosynthesis
MAKILELTNFSAGICGVWQRVKNESLLLSKNHEIRVFSSNAVKGGGEADKEDKIGKVKIKRFPYKKLGGESFMFWDFKREAIKFNPDIIIAHVYRHLNTTQALKVKQELIKKGGKCRVFLVTHAPFIKNNSTRSLFGKMAVNFYDSFIGKSIKKFDKVIYIAKWEAPHLKKLGVKKERLEYIPNGIPEEFFKRAKKSSRKKILFLGRVSQIKDLETLLRALYKVDKAELEIVGPIEKEYGAKLTSIIERLGLRRKVKFHPPIYNLKEKIKKIDEAGIFCLPSKREGQPQSLIEAMARKKVIIASDNRGAKEIIKDGENGFLFEVGNKSQLANKIDYAIKSKKIKKITKKAREKAKEFKWGDLIKKLERLIKNE